MNSETYWYWFASLGRIDAQKHDLLLSYYGHPKAFFHETLTHEACPILTDTMCEYVESTKNPAQIEASFANMKAKGISFLSPEDARFPDSLRSVTPAISGLFYIGDIALINMTHRVAIVGARKCSVYGRDVARQIGRELSAAGVCVVSGMAIGIDGAAHGGALDYANQISPSTIPTIGVLGCGVDICYPIEHQYLYDQIAHKGLLVSENPPGTKPLRHLFPQRNRIISGLSEAIVIVEAKKRSGSLITAELAIDQGRDVYAVPGRIHDSLSSGCNELILDGATPYLDTQRLLESLDIRPVALKCFHEKIEKTLEKGEILLYSFMDCEPQHIDILARKCDMNIEDTLLLAMKLELKGYIFQPIPNYYAKHVIY